MKIRFIIEKIDKLNTWLAVGRIYFMQDSGEQVFEYEAVSGGWAKGPLEPGLYNITSTISPSEMYSRKDKDAYTRDGIGWFATLTPLFETDRSALGIHPVGKRQWRPSTLGCIGIPFKNIDDNTRCWNLISGALEVKGIIDVEAIHQLGRVS